MPEKPAEKANVQRSAAGPISVIDYSCIANGCLYKWEKTRNSTGIAREDREGFLEHYGGQMARKVKLLAQRKVTLDGHPGREYVMEAPLKPGADPSTIVMRLYLVDDDMIQVRVFALEPGTKPRDAEAFFKTFRVIKPDPENKGQ
jgi:hypothetical protein